MTRITGGESPTVLRPLPASLDGDLFPGRTPVAASEDMIDQ